MDRYTWRQDFHALAGPIAAELLRKHGYPHDEELTPDMETVAELTVAQVDALHKEANKEVRKQLHFALNDLIGLWRTEAAEYAAVGAPSTIGETYAKCIEDIKSVVEQCFE